MICEIVMEFNLTDFWEVLSKLYEMIWQIVMGFYIKNLTKLWKL